jgi:hypothetical protein
MAEIENYLQFNVAWIEAPAISHCGHGIEFHWRENGEDRLIGFLAGYEWLHEGKGTVRVLVLSPSSPAWPSSAADYGRVMSDMKDLVHILLRKEKLHGVCKGNLRTRING